eukprot:3838993-Rhodomonas_salina.1
MVLRTEAVKRCAEICFPLACGFGLGVISDPVTVDLLEVDSLPPLNMAPPRPLCVHASSLSSCDQAHWRVGRWRNV